MGAPDAPLATISPYGANLNVTTVGDLSMTATKIANLSYLGGVNVNVGGALDVGGQFTAFGNPDSPTGIFTTSGGDVSVTANGNVNSSWITHRRLRRRKHQCKICERGCGTPVAG